MADTFDVVVGTNKARYTSAKEAGAAFFDADITQRPGVIHGMPATPRTGPGGSARFMASTEIHGDYADGSTRYVKRLPTSDKEVDNDFRAGYVDALEKSVNERLKAVDWCAAQPAHPSTAPKLDPRLYDDLDQLSKDSFEKAAKAWEKHAPQGITGPTFVDRKWRHQISEAQQTELTAEQVTDGSEAFLSRENIQNILGEHDVGVAGPAIGYYSTLEALAKTAANGRHWAYGECFVYAESADRFVILCQTAPASCEMLTLTQNGYHDVLTAYRYEPQELVAQLRGYMDDLMVKEERKQAELSSMKEEQRIRGAAWSPEEATYRAQRDAAEWRAESDGFEQRCMGNDMALNAAANPHYAQALRQAVPDAPAEATGRAKKSEAYETAIQPGQAERQLVGSPAGSTPPAPGLYSGRIVAVADGVVVQKVGRRDDDIVRYDVSRLDREPKVGEICDVTFAQDGRGSVKDSNVIER